MWGNGAFLIFFGHFISYPTIGAGASLKMTIGWGPEGCPPPHTIGSATLTLSTVCVFRNGVDTDNIDESHLEEEVVEFLVKEEETVLQD